MDPASIAFAQLAEELRRAHQFEEAIEACRAGLAIHPGYLSARVTLGRALIETNALDEARSELETVLKSAPENLAAIRGLAEILHRQGALPEALAQYRAALALAKNDPELQETVAELAKIVEPQKPRRADDGLSLEQIEHELFAFAPPAQPASAPQPPAPSITAPSAVPDPALSVADSSTRADSGGTLPHPADASPSTPVLELESQPENERAQRTVVALEQWLDAIHVARTQSRS